MIALMTGCSQQKQTTSVPAIDLSNFDTSIAPNEDFYQYATGGWQKKNPLKPEFARYGAFDVLRENNEVRINELFSQMTKSTAEKGSVEQKIADLYTMGLDSTRLNSEGLAPVKADIEQIMSVADLKQLSQLVAQMHMQAGNPLFGVGVSADLMNSNINALYIQQSGLGMGNRDYYLDAENAAMREGYTAWLTKAFTLYGMEDPAGKAAAVVAFETKMAEKFRSNVDLRDIAANYNPMSKADFVKRYDAIDWAAYFDGMGIGDFETIIVGQPETLDAVNTLLKTEPLETLRAYLAADYLGSAAPYLSDDIYAAYFDFFGRTLSGRKENHPRWKRATSQVEGQMGEALGKMYVERYFPASSKERMEKLVKNLQVSLAERIKAQDWMSDATKKAALDKLSTFYVKIGYPNKWKDMSGLTINPKLSYYENVQNCRKFWTKWDIDYRAGKPVDRDEWFMTPQTVNAYYNPTTNEICFPAGILQRPFFDPEADDAFNYGAIGVVIGHEMTHGFDDQGRHYDKDGNMTDWWTAADAENFNKKAEIFINYFSAIKVLPDLYANGKLTLGENLADHGGLEVSFNAFKKAMKDAPLGNIDGFTPEQRFFLAYAGLWAGNITDEEIRNLTKMDPHSLGVNRVNAALQHINAWYEAFNVKQGDKMFIPETERLKLW